MMARQASLVGPTLVEEVEQVIIREMPGWKQTATSGKAELRRIPS